MTLVATEQPGLARVKLAIDGLTSDIISVQRSLDETTWTHVRAGRRIVVTGDTHVLYDYEYVPDVINFYRVVDVAVPAFVAAGTADLNSFDTSGRDITPGLPAGIQAGDLLVLYVGQRNHSGGTAGQINPPAGWSTLLNRKTAPLLVNNYVYAKIAESGETAPVLPSGVSGGEIAQIAAWRGPGLPPDTFATDAEHSGTDDQIQVPPLQVFGTWSTAVAFGISNKGWTSAAAQTSWTLIDDHTVDGIIEDTSIVWSFQLQGSSASDVPTSFFEMTGGANSQTQGHGAMFAFTNAIETELFTDDLTPTLAAMWLKVPADATLNIPVELENFTPLVRPGRLGLFEVRGRAGSVAVTEVRGLRTATFTFQTRSDDDTADLQAALDPGDVVFLHVPTGHRLRRSMYLAVDAVDTVTLRTTPTVRSVGLDSTEVAAPAPEIFGTDPPDPS